MENARLPAELRARLIVGVVSGNAPEWSLWSAGSAVWFAAAGRPRLADAVITRRRCGGAGWVVSARSGRGWQRGRWAMPAASPIAAWGGLGITGAQQVPDTARQRTTGTWDVTSCRAGAFHLRGMHPGCGPKGGKAMSEVAKLRNDHPHWHIDTVWACAGSGPDRRGLRASRAGVTVRAWTAHALARRIAEETAG
jgi:hypothetical protein